MKFWTTKFIKRPFNIKKNNLKLMSKKGVKNCEDVLIITVS